MSTTKTRTSRNVAGSIVVEDDHNDIKNESKSEGSSGKISRTEVESADGIIAVVEELQNSDEESKHPLTLLSTRPKRRIKPSQRLIASLSESREAKAVMSRVELSESLSQDDGGPSEKENADDDDGDNMDHDDEDYVECGVCSKQVKTKNLSAHRKMHSQKELFPCSVCGKKFTKRFGLRRHMQVHEESIDSEYSMAKNLLSTKLSRGLNNTDYRECVVCHKVVKRQNMSEHMRVHSNRTKPISCPVCKKAFWKRYSMRRHMLSMHPKDTDEIASVLPCNVCGKIYKHPSSLHYHKLGHRERRYSCKYCGKKVLTNGALKRHVLVHTHGEILCRVCRRGFQDLEKLADHLETHTLEDFDKKGEQTRVSVEELESKNSEPLASDDEDENFTDNGGDDTELSCSKMVCGHCDKEFADIDEMNEHFADAHEDVLSDTEEMVSDATLRVIADVKEKRQDDNDEELVCGICDESLKGLTLLKKHITEVHPELLSDGAGKDHREKNLSNPRKLTIEQVSCGRCDESFTVLADLNEHILEHHSDVLSEEAQTALKARRRCALKQAVLSNKIRCGHCDATFDKIEQMNVHIVEVHADLVSSEMLKSAKRRKAEKIEALFDEEDEEELLELRRKCLMKKHQRMRKTRGKGKSLNTSPRMREELTTCPICNMSLRWDGVKSHIDRVHHKKLNASCEICGKKFFNKVSLRRHYVAVHREELSLETPSFRCKTCGANYKSRSSLYSHVQVKHKTKTYSCWCCGRVFKELSILNKHLLLHDQNSVRCRLCRFVYKDWERLEVHMARVHPDVDYVDIKEHGILNRDREKQLKKTKTEEELVDILMRPDITKETSGEESAVMVVEMDETAPQSFDISIQMEDGSTENVTASGDAEVPDVYLCQICNAGFRDSNALIAHCVTVHPDTLRIVFEEGGT